MILAALVEVPGLVSADRLRASEDAAQVGDLASAHSLAQSAIAAEPWAATPHQQLASIELLQGQLNQASREIRKARRMEPDTWRIPLVPVQIDATKRSPRRARRAFLTGRRLAPRLQFYGLGSYYASLAYSHSQLVRLYFRHHPKGRSQ